MQALRAGEGVEQACLTEYCERGRGVRLSAAAGLASASAAPAKSARAVKARASRRAWLIGSRRTFPG
jgi:hypothetical protein